MKKVFNNGKIIGEFDLYDYNLPTIKGYLFHQISDGGNHNDKYPQNREYLRILGLTKDNELIEYGYIYFILYTDNDGLKVSSLIGLKVSEDYRGKGIGDLLMSIYLYYSYDNGYYLVDSVTKQRKLDVLSLMNKYGFKLLNPEIYEYGNRTTIYKNSMVIDIYKQRNSGLYYRFKTKKAEITYRRDNHKISDNYNYLPAQNENDIDENLYNHKGWIVPNEEYSKEYTKAEESLIQDKLDKSGFSK